MRLEKKREAELAERKGAGKRTMLMLGWLAISGVAAYFLASYMFSSGILTYRELYNQLSLSPNDVPPWAVLGGVIVVLVIVFQFFVMVGFFIASPEGRRRTGDPSLSSTSNDPFDNPFD